MTDNDVDPGPDNDSSAAAASDESASKDSASKDSASKDSASDKGTASERGTTSAKDAASAKDSSPAEGAAPVGDAVAAQDSGSADGSEETVKIAAASESAEATVKIDKKPAKAESAPKAGQSEAEQSESRKVKSGKGKAAGAGAAVGGAAGRAGASRGVSTGVLVGAGAVGAIALVAAVGAAGYFFVQNTENKALLDAHEEARLAACEYAPRLADYDAKNLDAYFSGVLEGATGDWYEQFDDTSRELREVLAEGQVVSKVQHVECAIKTGDETSAEAVIMIGQTITSVGTQGQPSPGQLAMVLRMEKTDGRWLVNHVDSPLPAPQQ